MFCSTSAGELPSVKASEDEQTYAFMDIYPGLGKHLPVVPKQHSQELLNTPPDDLAAAAGTAKREVGPTEAPKGAMCFSPLGRPPINLAFAG